MRKDIAGLSEIRRPVIFRTWFKQLGDNLSTDFLALEVTLVVKVARIPGHMVAPKTITERNLVPNFFVAERHKFAPVGTGNHRPRRQPRYSPGLSDGVTVHAATRTLDYW